MESGCVCAAGRAAGHGVEGDRARERRRRR